MIEPLDPARPPRRLILAGGGHAHLAVLAAWIADTPLDLETWLITPTPDTIYSGMVPGWIEGLYDRADLVIDLQPLAEKAGVRLIIGRVAALDADQKIITLDSGAAMPFDVLSLGVGGSIDPEPLSTLGSRVLPVRPIEGLIAHWPSVVSAARHKQNFALSVVGGGAAGVELSLAAHQAIPAARVTLVTGGAGLLRGHAPAVVKRARRALEREGIAVIEDEALGAADGLQLSHGALVLVDHVIAATGSVAPHWLISSGLVCDADGFVCVDPCQRSVSHPAIFATGDCAVRTDRAIARSGVHAVKAGPVLAANLRAALQGRRLRGYEPAARTLYLLAIGKKRAIVSWGRFSASGRLVWRLKNWIDRRFVGRFRDMGKS